MYPYSQFIPHGWYTLPKCSAYIICTLLYSLCTCIMLSYVILFQSIIFSAKQWCGDHTSPKPWIYPATARCLDCFAVNLMRRHCCLELVTGTTSECDVPFFVWNNWKKTIESLLTICRRFNFFIFFIGMTRFLMGEGLFVKKRRRKSWLVLATCWFQYFSLDYSVLRQIVVTSAATRMRDGSYYR